MGNHHEKNIISSGEAGGETGSVSCMCIWCETTRRYCLTTPVGLPFTDIIDKYYGLTVTFLLPTYVDRSVRIALQVALHILNVQNKTNRPVSNSVDGFVSAHQITYIKALATDTWRKDHREEHGWHLLSQV